MANIVDSLDITLTVQDTISESTSPLSVSANITNNVIEEPITVSINEIIINNNSLSLIDTSNSVYIRYQNSATITNRVHLPENLTGDYTLKVIFNVVTTTTNTTTRSITINIIPDLELNDKTVDGLLFDDKRVIQLNSNNKTIWKNGVWFTASPENIGVRSRSTQPITEYTTITGTFWRHNHKLRNSSVNIHTGELIYSRSLCSDFDFFTSYGALTVTRTLTGFTASGEQQAAYICKTSLEANARIHFIMGAHSTTPDKVYLYLLADDNHYDSVDLSVFDEDDEIEIVISDTGKSFTVLRNNIEDDEYSYSSNYTSFRFNIGSGNLTVDDFYVEKDVSSVIATSENISQNNSIKYYKSCKGMRIVGTNSVGVYLKNQQAYQKMCLEFDLLNHSGSLSCFIDTVNLSEIDNGHIKIIYDSYYFDLFVDDQLIKSVKSPFDSSEYISYPLIRLNSSNVTIKNLKYYAFNKLSTVTTNSEGQATTSYNTSEVGDILLIGEYKDTPTVPYSLEDCFYKPLFSQSTITNTVRQGVNSNYYTYVDSDTGGFKGACLYDGWSNSGRWECSFQLAYWCANGSTTNGGRYTGLAFTDPDNAFVWGILNWECHLTADPRDSTGEVSSNFVKTGNLSSLESGQSIYNQRIGWHYFHMRKETDTRLVVWKNDDWDNRVIYEWEELSEPAYVTIGGLTNLANQYAQSEYATTFIRNLHVKKI